MATPKQNPANVPPTDNSWRNYLIFIAVVALLIAGIVALRPILMPFFAGALLAYLGSPLVDRLASPRRFRRLAVPRSVGGLLVMALLLLIVSLMLFLLVPLIQTETATMAKRLPEWFAHLTTNVLPRVETWLGISLSLDLQSLRTLISEHLSGLSDVSLTVLTGLKNSSGAVFALLVNLALIPVVVFYLLRDWPVLVSRIDKLIPRRWHETTTTLLREIDAVLAEFIRGQALVMLSLAVYYSVALWFTGLEFALPIGLLTGLLVFIPYVGFGLGMILAVLAALLQPDTGIALPLTVLAVYGIGQLLENYLLVPYLVGDRIGLHPLAVIFALLAFSQLFGFVGVLLALPVSAVLLVALRHIHKAYLNSQWYMK